MEVAVTKMFVGMGNQVLHTPYSNNIDTLQTLASNRQNCLTA